MKFNIKNLAIILCSIASCNAMRFNNNNINYTNNFELNNNMKQCIDFYNNPESIKKYLSDRIKNINNNGMQLNYEDCSEFDLHLFAYNIDKYPSAKTNIEVLLNSLIPNDTNTINKIKDIITSNNKKYILNILLDNNNISLILKKLIIGVNVGTILFNEENKKTSNDISNINPILLLDGNDQCWFNSTLQLINSAVECAPKEVLSKLTNKPGYVLVEFLNYLKEESKKFFKDYNKKHVLDKSSKENIDGLLLYNKFKEFEKKLSKNQLDAWNELPGVKEGKEIMNKINLLPGGRPGTCPTAMAILSKMFPEVNDLFYYNWENISLEQFYDIKFNLWEFGDLINKIPSSSDPYFISDTWDYYSYDNNNLQQQITNNQWRIGFDNNDNFVIYTVKGLHLIAPGLNTKIGNGSAHAALDNSSNNWYFSDTEGYNSNPSDNLDVLAPAINEHIKKSGYPKFDSSKMQIREFMYREMTNEEIKKYINS